MNGRYQPPSPEGFIETVNKVKYSGQRKPLLESLQTQTKDDISHEALLGACIYTNEVIGAEYYFASPEKKAGYLYDTGSELFAKMKTDVLKVSDQNPLDNKSKFIYLNHYLNYLKSDKCTLPDAEKERHIKDVTAKTKAVLKNLNLAVELLLIRPPILSVFYESFARLPEEYKKRCSPNGTWASLFGLSGHDKTRDPYVIFIQGLAEQYKFLGKSKDTEEKSVAKQDPVAIDSYNKMYSIILTMMMDIEPSYYVRSASNSIMHTLCEEITNLQDTTQMSNELKDKYLSAGTALVTDILASPPQLAMWKQKGLDKSFFTALRKQLGLQQTALQADCGTTSLRLNGLLSSLTTSATQYGVFGLVIALENSAFRNLTLGATSAVLMPEYAVICAIIFALRKQIGSYVASAVSSQVSSTITSAIKLPAKLVYCAVAGLQHLCADLEAMVAAPEEEPEWIMALHNAPADIFSEKQKQRLAKVVDIQQVQNTMSSKVKSAPKTSAMVM